MPTFIGSAATQQLIDVALTVFDANGDLLALDFGSPEFFGDGGVDGIESPSDPDPFVTLQLDPGFYTAVLRNSLGATASILDDDLLTLDFRETLGGTDDDAFGFLIDRTTGLAIPGTSAEVRLAIAGVVLPRRLQSRGR